MSLASKRRTNPLAPEELRSWELQAGAQICCARLVSSVLENFRALKAKCSRALKMSAPMWLQLSAATLGLAHSGLFQCFRELAKQILLGILRCDV
jgi:hypothetical protein